MSEALRISIEQAGSEDQVVKVRVEGVLDTLTSPDLEKVMNQLLEQKRHKIIMDLAGVDYISSAGWGIFVSHIKELREKGGDLKLARMLPNVFEIFELLEFDSIFKSYDNLEKARTDFARDRKIESRVANLTEIEGKKKVFVGS